MKQPRDHYLTQAKRARELAAVVAPALRSDFLRVAENWEMLARHYEERKDIAPTGRE